MQHGDEDLTTDFEITKESYKKVSEQYDCHDGLLIIDETAAKILSATRMNMTRLSLTCSQYLCRR